ncbi:MAG: hypothetical protein RLY20_892 [Verrucomicrobiota bacterium]
MKLWQYDPNAQDDALFIANWSDARAKHYEAETYRYLGIRPEPTYTWSKAFRPKKSRARKVADVVDIRRKRA